MNFPLSFQVLVHVVVKRAVERSRVLLELPFVVIRLLI